MYVDILDVNLLDINVHLECFDVVTRTNDLGDKVVAADTKADGSFSNWHDVY